jgi:hypothetical protein
MNNDFSIRMLCSDFVHTACAVARIGQDIYSRGQHCCDTVYAGGKLAGQGFGHAGGVDQHGVCKLESDALPGALSQLGHGSRDLVNGVEGIFGERGLFLGGGGDFEDELVGG